MNLSMADFGQYGALSPILELIRFTLLWNLGESSYSVMDKAVGLATETLQAYVLPRHPAKNLKAMSQKQGLGHQIIPDLTLDHCHTCMAILEGIALDAVGEEHTLRRYVYPKRPKNGQNFCADYPSQFLASDTCRLSHPPSFHLATHHTLPPHGHGTHHLRYTHLFRSLHNRPRHPT